MIPLLQQHLGYNLPKIEIYIKTTVIIYAQNNEESAFQLIYKLTAIIK